MSHPIQQRIEHIRRRAASARLATGLCLTLTVVLVAAQVLGVADFLVRYVDPGLRLLATAALVFVAGWAVTRFLWPALRRPLTSLAVAERLERAFPQLEDRLASSLDFLGQSEDDPQAGSAELRRAVIADTAVQVEGLPLESAIDRQPVRRAAKWLTMAVAVLLVALALDASSVGIAARRLVAPLSAAEWPRQHRLAFRNLPSQLAVGTDFEVEVVDENGTPPDDVTVHFRFRGNQGTDFDSQAAEPIGDVLVVHREDVRRTFDVRVTGGDDFTMPWHRVDVVEPPQLASLEIVAHPPTYTGMSSTPAEKHIQVLAGTRLELSVSSQSEVRAAKLRLGSGSAIDAEPVDSAGADSASTFRIAGEQWVATQSDTYWIELEDANGLTGTSDRWHLRVEPDPPPIVHWRQPQADLFVMPEAVVPLSLSVRDNLAIKSAHLVYLRSDDSEAGDQTIELFVGPEHAAPANAEDAASLAQQQTIDYSWQLAPLELEPGVALSLIGRATDYRPGIGETPSPRRIVIITRDELDQRIADRQNQIAQRLEQALQLERTTRDQIRRVEIQARDVGRLENADQDTLQSARLGQRRVESQLVDPAAGVTAEIDELMAELVANGLHDSDVQSQMKELLAALGRLAEGPLPTIEQQLTAASKSIDSDVEVSAERAAPMLAQAGEAQDEVIGSLETLLESLSQWAGYQRFAREVAQLRKEQLELHETSRQQLGVARPTNSRQQDQWEADVTKMAAAQHELSRRFDKLSQHMEQATKELTAQDATAAATLQDTLDQARDLGISAELREAATDFRQQRVGRATAGQQQAADHLEQLLATLRNRREQQLDQLVAQLQQAERELAELRERLGNLREQIEQSEQLPDAEQRELEQDPLRQQSEELEEAIERMARRLKRLEAELAGQSAERAAENLAQHRDEASPEDPQDSMPTGAEARDAERNLAEAAEQLAERRRQAEESLAQQQMARLESLIRAAVDRQRHILEGTLQFDQVQQATGQLSFEQLRGVLQLADEQQGLVQELDDFGDLLGSMGVFRLALGETSADMRRAAGLLYERQVDTPTQEAEQLALDRLEQIAKALERNPPPPEENQGGQQGGSGQGGQQGPQLQLAEIKLLRMLQDDLRRRTTSLQERTAGEDPPEDGTLAELGRALAAEQGRLAELVLEILSRDNAQGRPAEADDPSDQDGAAPNLPGEPNEPF